MGAQGGPRFELLGIRQGPGASILKSSSALDMAAVSWIVAPTSENMCGIRLVISLEAGFDETSPLAQEESKDRQQKQTVQAISGSGIQKNADWDSSSRPRMETKKTPTNQK